MRPRAVRPEELVGIWELAQILGRPKQGIHGLIDSRKAQFPAPWARLRMGPIWLRGDVDAWVAAHPVRAQVVPRNRNGVADA